MASEADLDFTYSLTDRLFRLSMGELSDFSGAKYDGDFTLTLEAAQRRKHEFVVAQIRAREGSRILDLGCGWGGLLAFLRERGMIGVGATLSRAQARSCRRNGLDVHLLDCRSITPDALGAFDGLASLGAFEHFCSIEDWQDGRQDAIYSGFFRNMASFLPAGGRFYLQTMVFGKRRIPYEAFDLHAPRLSDGHVLALLQRTFPGSWLPAGVEQVESAAEPYFHLVFKESGRLDYLATIRDWRARFGTFTWRKGVAYLELLPRYLSDPDFRAAFTSGISANSIAFERDLLDHYRIVLERR
jgi:cyclopropane-fatty-acyl-phospholipid synthase